MATARVVGTRPVINDTVPHDKLQFDQKKPIGSGAFGTVYKVIHKDWGCLVAYKRLGIQFITEEHCITALKNEEEIHRQLRHPNIVSMLGLVFEDGHYGLVLEYIMFGSLDAFLGCIKKFTGATFRMSCMLKTRMSYEVCCGMSYLHGLLPMPVIHGDLKTQNILVGKHLTVKISDFGLSKWKDYSRTQSNAAMVQGTPSYIPPQKWMNPELSKNEKFDVYSFGILQWELFAEVEAFEASKTMIMSLVICGQRPYLEKLSCDVAPAIKAHMSACWQQEPDKRPAFAELATELMSLIHRPETENEIERGVRNILAIYCGRSDSTGPNSENGGKLERVSQQLCANIRRIDQILNILVERRVISRDESELIRRDQPTVLICAQRLIDVLSSKPVTAYQCFLDSLVKTNQSHLCALLESGGADMNMDHREVLIDHYTFLKANLDVTQTGLLDHLLQSRVLDDQEMREIQSRSTLDESVDLLLHFIMRTSPEQYELFQRALRESNLAFIAEQLLIANGALPEPQTAVCLSAPVLRMESQLKTVDASALSVTDSKKRLRVKEKYRNKAIEFVGSSLFLSKWSVVRVIPGADKGQVSGIVVLGSQLFIARYVATSVEVYDATNITATPRLLKISDETLNSPRLAACSHYNCLYVMHFTEPVVYRVELSNSSVSSWTVMRAYAPGVSITNDHIVLLTMSNVQVREYTTIGELIREISLDPSIVNPHHCIQLSDGNFVVCHCGSKQHRVCIVNTSGRIIKSYGGSPGSGVDQLNYPCQLSVDKYDHLFVADCNNNRVQFLSPMLTLLGTVQIPGHKLSCLDTLHFDKINHRLYVNSLSDVLIVELSKGIQSVV